MEKVAIVTGSSSGIGREITKILLQEGYKVYGISRTKSTFDDSQFVWIKADLTKSSTYSKFLKGIKENKIDILVNNAGVAFEQNAFGFNQKSFEEVFDINYKAPILLTQLFRKKLRNGLVINISSVSDRLVGEKYGLYCSSKSALNIFFDVVSLEERNIKFVSILPSYVDTKLLRNLQKQREFEWKITLKPEEIAEFIKNVIGNKEITSGSKIIIVNDSLIEDLEYKENLWGYNVTKRKLFKLKQ